MMRAPFFFPEAAMTKIIGPQTVVHIHYTLSTDADGEIDTSRDGAPFAYLHGAENIVPGLERQLLGKRVGDTLLATVPPAEGYGERDDDGVEVFPLDAFPADAELEPGTQIMLEDEEGEATPFWVIEVDQDEVTVDRNHPLAGDTLTFDVEVIGIRAASAEELQHGHPHEPGGHQH
jgi:FKBP-type peptidyl-prolyl cis-trans isomerase SlyD